MGDPNFQLLFQQSPDVLLVLLPDPPRFTMVAATATRLQVTHTTLEETVGRGLFELFPDNPEDPGATGAANLRASLERVLATRAADTMAVQKYDIRGPDGQFQSRYWSPKNIPVTSPAGEVLYIIHRVEDVTELVRAGEVGEELRDRTRQMEREVVNRSRELAAANRELREANAKLGELDAAKTAFFNNVSHEFRTPLTLMLGPLEDALAEKEAALPPLLRRRIELAHANALRLLALVNVLLDFSRLEAGRLEAQYAPLDLAKATAQLAGMFQSAMDKADVRLIVECPSAPAVAWVDRDMWETVVANLISNAFKFTFAGEIAVRLREDESRFVLEVADSGVGIPEAELPRIFDRFHRVAGARGRSHEGTGIGLALVRELVALHRGDISVTSVPGTGTTFRVTIPKGSSHLPAQFVRDTPVEPAEHRDRHAMVRESARWTATAVPDHPRETRTAPDERGRARPRVLIVDDNAELREYISSLLSPVYDVSTAVDGADALAAVRERRPDLVVSDVMMPGLNGAELVRAMRAEPSVEDLPVILVSARAGEEAAIEGLDAGADDYLAKPFSARELLARVRTHVELARRRRACLVELERSNRELDAFSYSVSHDLRAPLRAVDGFSRALLDDYEGALDEQGRRYLERIRNGVQRMAALIDDLLGLARIARAPLKAADVDLSTMAAEIVDELRRAQPDREVAVSIAEGLRVRGDQRLLNVALVNMLGNAWKFTSRTNSARIEVGGVDGEHPTFFVRDNGAGFDVAAAGRQLFAPFQRFHSADAYEGTGIGLATVKRVIARHGGHLWAESTPGEGATFFFTLPAIPPPAAA